MPQERLDQGGWRLRGILGPGFRDTAAACPPARSTSSPAPPRSPSPEQLPGTAALLCAGHPLTTPVLLEEQVGSANAPPSSKHPVLPWVAQAALVAAPSLPGPCITPAPQQVQCRTDHGRCWRVCRSTTPFARCSLHLCHSLKPRLPEAGSSLWHPHLCPSPGLQPGQALEMRGCRHPCWGDSPLRLGRAWRSPWGGRVSPAAV